MEYYNRNTLLINGINRRVFYALMEYYKCYDKCYEFLLLINGDFNIPSKSFLLPIKHWEFYGDVIEWNFISQQPEMITMGPASLNSLLRTYAGV